MGRTRSVTTCPACGLREPARARWCGDCGALLPVPDEALWQDEQHERLPEVVARPGRRHWALLVGVTIGLLVAALVANTGTPSATTLLGRLDDATGRSSTLPPADDLQRVWQRVVDTPPGDGSPPPALHDLGDGHVLVGDAVVDLRTGARVGTAPRGRVVPDADGHTLLLDDREVLDLDLRTGHVVDRAALTAGPGGWLPEGAPLGTAGGAWLFIGADGVLGAVGSDGGVRWVGDPSWRWDGAGAGTDWLVVVAREEPTDRALVVDAASGTVHRDLGPAATVHAPVVLGDALVYVDPGGAVDRGAGSPVPVRGLRLDGSGRSWAVNDLQFTSGPPDAVRTTVDGDAVVVEYSSAGVATTAVWLDPVTGSRIGVVAVAGTGRTDEGWPHATVAGGGVVHVHPARDEIWLIERGIVRWQRPAVAGEGLVGDGGVVLVRTPPRGTSLQSRLRVLDAATGAVLWEQVTTDVQHQDLVGVLAGHVGTSGGPWPGALRDQAWFALDTGRRRSGVGLAADVLGIPLGDAVDLRLLGHVTEGSTARPVFLDGSGAGGRLVGSTPAEAPDLAALLGGGGAVSGIATVEDADLRVQVGTGAVVATDPVTGAQRWRAATDMALRRDQAVLLPDVVVTVALDGSVVARDRADGAVRWTVDGVLVTALTAGGESVVAGTVAGEVLVIEDGVVVQRLATGSDPVEDVAVIEEQVLATAGQHLLAFGRGAAIIDVDDRVDLP